MKPETNLPTRSKICRIVSVVVLLGATGACRDASSDPDEAVTTGSALSAPVGAQVSDVRATSQRAPSDLARSDAPKGMVWIPSGEFTLGTDSIQSFPDERPAHRVKLSGFWMDRTEVTNAQFRAFVDATEYLTTAERKPEMEEIMAQLPEGTPRPDPSVLVAGSLMFTPTAGPVSLANPGTWWLWTPGASWQHPEGPDSTIDGRANHPVVHVSWDDANAYAAWAGKRLPTEAEWERAARGGTDGARFTWGDQPQSDTDAMSNIWTGAFPWKNDRADGFDRTAPVGKFPPNAYGLVDMAGNVWEWCSDWYRNDTYAMRAGVAVVEQPPGPTHCFDPQEPTVPKRVMRGGSFLCHDSYCAGYRPSARMKSSPDTSLSHTGFRCVRSGALVEE